MDVTEVGGIAARIRAEVGKAVIGQTETVDLMLTALFCGGHILLEGPPGTAKTLLAQTFARTLSLHFGRIQFTPDLMPGDILGSNIFNFQTSTFTLTRGPVFCDLLLADEINRTPPKTQAALLEAMQERSVTVDGDTHALSDRFTVIATQNPIEQQGVYPLPEAQLDRFLFKQTLDYLSREDELKVVQAHGAHAGMPDPAALGVQPVADAAAVAAAIQTVAGVHLSPCRPGPRPAPGPCWPSPPAPARFWTAATMSSPTTSRAWPCRPCVTRWCCRPRPRSRVGASRRRYAR